MSVDGARLAPWLFVPIWASGFVSARLAMPHAPPLSFLSWRFALSALCLALWLAWSRPAWPRRNARLDWVGLGHVAVAGLLMQVGYLGGVWSAVRWGMGAGLIAILVGLQPMVTAVWLHLRGTVPVRAHQWWGLLIGLVGVALAVGHKLDQGEVGWANGLAAVGALAAITVGTLYQKAHVPAIDVRIAQLVQMIASFGAMGPLSLFEPGGLGTSAWPWHPDLVVALAWSVLGLTLGGSSLLFWLIARGAAMRVTSLLYLVPPMTAVMAWALFGEALGWHVLLALVLTATGVWLVNRR